ncbi:MAG: universal stress protein [Paludibacteraceae bacterium]|nr:universal stress protein [Paludibacteraceae bacterium]
MKKVLIALDFDPTAQKVAEAGYFLAKAMNAEVTLIHVVADVTYYSDYSVLDTYPSTGIMGIQGMEAAHLFDNSLKDAMTRFLEKSKTHLGDKEIKTIVKEGDFGKIILKTAQEMKANVIVMGSHSRRWLENIIMGSVTEDVLRHTTIPLFIVPTKKK